MLLWVSSKIEEIILCLNDQTRGNKGEFHYIDKIRVAMFWDYEMLCKNALCYHTVNDMTECAEVTFEVF